MNTPTPRKETLLSFDDIATVPSEVLIERTLEYVSNHQGCMQAKLLAETAVLCFARERWRDYCADGVRKKLHDYDLLKNLEIPIDQVSAVSACMNRNEHLTASVASWLASDRFSEIIIVDFGSDIPVMATLLKANLLCDDRIRVIRVEASKWCLAEAFNIGLFESTSVFTFKLDADTIIRGNAEKSLMLSATQFKSGNWRTFKNNYLNGIVLAPTEAIRRAGGYNEQIRRYGFDDCDFYDRLCDLGFAKVDLEENEFISIEHSDHDRLKNSDEIAINTDINILIQGNRVFANILPKWTEKSKRYFTYSNLKNKYKIKFLEISELAYRLTSIHFKFLYTSDKFLYEDVLDEIHTAIFSSGVLDVYRINCQNQQEELGESRKDCVNVQSELSETIRHFSWPPAGIPPPRWPLQTKQGTLSTPPQRWSYASDSPISISVAGLVDQGSVLRELDEYRLNCQNLKEELSESRKDCANAQSELSETMKSRKNKLPK